MSLLAALVLVAAPLQQVPAPPDSTESSAPEAAVEAVEAVDDSIVIDDEPRYDDEDEGPGIELRPRLAPSALYSNNRGFGIGGGIGVRNLGWTGSDITVDLRLQQRFQSAGVTLFTQDPYESRLHGLFSVSGSTTERRRYYGLGPYTVTDNELNLFHDAAQAEARVGWYPFETTALYLQPGVRYLFDRSEGVNDDASTGSLAALDPVSREAVDVADDNNRYGLSVGLEVATDLRDWPSYPRRGAFGTVEYRRFYALDASELTLDRYSGSWIGYLPLDGRTALVGRGVGVITRSGDADGDGLSDPIPFYYLPTLDDRVATAFRQDRLTGRDVVAFGAGIRFPVFDALGVYGLDALLMGFIGNAYDDVFEQFEPTISFSETAAPEADGGAPLRPALALGLGIVNLDKERVVVGGLLGVGPGGVTVATLRVAYDLRDARPLFR